MTAQEKTPLPRSLPQQQVRHRQQSLHMTKSYILESWINSEFQKRNHFTEKNSTAKRRAPHRIVGKGAQRTRNRYRRGDQRWKSLSSFWLAQNDGRHAKCDACRRKIIKTTDKLYCTDSIHALRHRPSDENCSHLKKCVRWTGAGLPQTSQTVLKSTGQSASLCLL